MDKLIYYIIKNINIYKVYICDSIACWPRKRPTAKGVMYRDLSRFTLYGITLKEAPTITLENIKKKNILLYFIYQIHIFTVIFIRKFIILGTGWKISKLWKIVEKI